MNVSESSQVTGMIPVMEERAHQESSIDGLVELGDIDLIEFHHVLSEQPLVPVAGALAFDGLHRRKMVEAYGALAQSMLDGDQMLRKRLDLVAPFVFPELDTFPASRFADSVRDFIRANQDDGGLLLKVHGLSRAVTVLGSVDDLVELADAKHQLDDWMAEIVQLTRPLPEGRIKDRVLVAELAGQLQDSDPMTKAGSVFGRELAELRDAKAEIDDVRDAARKAAGMTADASLSAHFDQDATKDGGIATKLSLSSVAFLLASFGVGLFIVLTSDDISWGVEIAKLALTLPLLAASAYAGRLSSHYREAARWAQTASIQFKTIDAYVAGLPDAELRNEIKVELGRRVFGDPGFKSQPKNPDTEDVVAIVDAVGRAIRKDGAESK